MSGGFGQLAHYADDAASGFGGSAAAVVVAGAVGLTFAWSAVAKARRPWLTAMALVDFRVARRARPAAGTALAATELLLGLALIAGAAVSGTLLQVAAIGTLLLSLAFVALIGRALRAGAAFPCQCFGDGDAPVSATTLVRAIALAVATLALALTAQQHETLPLADTLLALSAGAGVVGVVSLLSAARGVWHLPRPDQHLTGAMSS